MKFASKATFTDPEKTFVFPKKIMEFHIAAIQILIYI